MSSKLHSQSFMLAFKNEMLAAGIPLDKHHLFNQSSQLQAFKIIVLQEGIIKAIAKIDEILLFKSYIQVRALEHGAPISKALLFDDTIKLRAYEAGATIAKALRTRSLKYVQNLEKKKVAIDGDQLRKQVALVQDKFYSSDIVENLKAPIKYHLVSDIDDVLCREIDNNSADYAVNQEWINGTYPGVEIIKWQKNNDDEKIYFCYPGFDKLLLAISLWNGWSIDFFSAEIDSRNEMVIPNYFSKKLGGEVYSKLIEAGRLNIFSKQHLTAQDTAIPGSYHLVKNLSVITTDTDNSILIDDNVNNAAKGQEQMIGLSIEASKEIIAMVRNQEDSSYNMLYNPLNNAAYIMGIMLEAKKLLDTNEAYCLREAIDITLRHNNLDDSKCSSPWYVYPICALEHDNEYLGKMQQWVQNGQDYLDQFIGSPSMNIEASA